MCARAVRRDRPSAREWRRRGRGAATASAALGGRAAISWRRAPPRWGRRGARASAAPGCAAGGRGGLGVARLPLGRGVRVARRGGAASGALAVAPGASRRASPGASSAARRPPRALLVEVLHDVAFRFGPLQPRGKTPGPASLAAALGRPRQSRSRTFSSPCATVPTSPRRAPARRAAARRSAPPAPRRAAPRRRRAAGHSRSQPPRAPRRRERREGLLSKASTSAARAGVWARAALPTVAGVPPMPCLRLLRSLDFPGD